MMIIQDSNLHDIFAGTNAYRVPDFQRGFVWTDEDIIDFFRSINSTDEEFLGSVILLNHAVNDATLGGVPDNIERFYIVDGQQRITAMSIITCALYKYAIQNNIQYNQYFAFNNILYWIQVNGNIGYLKLLPSQSIYRFYVDFLTNTQARHENFREIVDTNDRRAKSAHDCYLEVYKEIDKLCNGNEQAFTELVNVIFTNLTRKKITRIQTDSVHQAYETFINVNAKGEDLSAADLIKSRYIQNNPVEGNLNWSSIENNINGTAIKDIILLIHYYWLTKVGDVSKRKLYTSISSAHNRQNEWANTFNQILVKSRIIKELHNGDFNIVNTNTNSIKRCYRILSAFSSKTWLLPFITVSRNQFDDSAIKFFSKFEYYIIAYTYILGRPANSLHSKLINTCKNISNRNISYDQAYADLYNQLNTSSEELADRIKLVRYDSRRDTKQLITAIIRYYDLAEINNVADIEYGVYDNKNIEHILPQNPHADWHVDIHNFRDLIDNIGNLTLLSGAANQAARNFANNEKFDRYAAANRPINEGLTQNDWVVSEEQIRQNILERRDRIAEVVSEYLYTHLTP